MAIRKQIALVCVTVIVLSFAFGCGNGDSATDPEPGRHEITWLSASLNVSAGAYKSYSRSLESEDTISMEITLLEGDHIGAILIVDGENLSKWSNGESFVAVFYRTNSSGGNFQAIISSNDTYYFVVYNSAPVDDIQVACDVKVIRWY